MIRAELLLEDVRTKEELRRSLANAFGVRIEEVYVVDDVVDLPSFGAASILCEQQIRSGQFGWHLTVYSQDSQAWPSECEVAKSLSQSLKTRCLISDEAINPFTMILVTGAGNQSVNLDVDKLGRLDEYWLE